MSVIAVEGVFEAGVVRLTTDVALPEGTRVYVIAPDAVPVGPTQPAGVEPLRREDLADFEMTMIE